jgi:hypothetical protein
MLFHLENLDYYIIFGIHHLQTVYEDGALTKGNSFFNTGPLRHGQVVLSSLGSMWVV